MTQPLLNLANATLTAGERRTRMLRTAMGPAVGAALEDPDVIEVLVNPDGSLWLDRVGTGLTSTGITLSAQDAERIIRVVAAQVGAEITSGSPILSAELPLTGERFEGVVPPVVRAPSFAIRKRAMSAMSLTTYVRQGVMTLAQADFLRAAVAARLNILVAGGASTGKTTLVNALLQEVARTGDRVILLEDTIELQCLVDDHVPMRSYPGVATLAELVRSTLRLRPDRIIVGEVRGGEALDLLKAWGTGHPGGLATLHAGSAAGALARLEQLILEVAASVSRALIVDAVQVIAVLEGRGNARRLSELVRVTGVCGERYQLEPITSSQGETP